MLRRRKFRGFTIIELMVVILIIGVLASLLLPALSAARGAARTTTGANNLKQLTLAWMMHQQTKQGEMMPSYLWDPANPNLDQYWYGEVNRTPNPDTLDFDRGILAPFMETEKKSYEDPDFGFDDLDETIYNTMTTAYGYNARFLGPGVSLNYDSVTFAPISIIPPGTMSGGNVTQPPSYNISALETTSRTIVFADSAQSMKSDFVTPGLRENYRLEPPSRFHPSIHFRHRGDVANVSFADGHVAQIAWDPKTVVLGGFMTAGQVTFCLENKIGYAGLTDALYDHKKEPVD